MEHLKQEGLAQVAIDKFTGGVSDILIDAGIRAREPAQLANRLSFPIDWRHRLVGRTLRR
jgi:hypothetical protein